MAATYYSSHNAAGGGAGTIGDPFTIQELFDTVTSADLGLVMATGTYTPSAKLDLDTNTGTQTAKPTIRGCASDGTDDGTVATISGSSLPGSTTLLQIGAGIDYLVLANLTLTGSTLYGIDTNSQGTILQNVRITASASHGIYQQTLNDVITLIDCEIDNNSGAGYEGPATSRGSIIMHGGSVHNNTSHGLRSVNVSSLFHVLIYKNGSHGVILAANNTHQEVPSILNCTIASNTGNGIEVLSIGVLRLLTIIKNTILYENGGFGLDLNGADIDQFECVNLAVHNNSSGDISAGTFPGVTTTTDPAFANEGAGTEDYTPSATALKVTYTSPSGIGGSNYEWIGAIQPDSAGGGGSSGGYVIGS